MSVVACKYASAPQELYAGPSVDQMRRVENPDRFLCAWALFHPDSAGKLTGTPPWLQRNAMAGHLMQPDDCVTCPCFERGGPVE